MKTKIFGQEPAAVASAVEVVVGALLSLGLFGLTLDQAGAITALVTAALALAVAYATKHTALSLFTGLVKAGLVAAATFGWALSSEQQAAVITVVSVVGGLLIRQNNASLTTAISSASPGAHKATA